MGGTDGRAASRAKLGGMFSECRCHGNWNVLQSGTHFGGRTCTGMLGEEVMDMLWDVYRADVRGVAVDIWAFMRTVKANVITVERVFGEPRCLSGYVAKGVCVDDVLVLNRIFMLDFIFYFSLYLIYTNKLLKFISAFLW